MAYQPKKRKMTAEINVVPYIDVMLVLLIIFMVTAPFVTQGVDVELPSTQTAKTAAELVGDENSSAPIIVEVDQNGNLGLSVDNGEMLRGLRLNDLLTRVRAELQLNPQVDSLGWRGWSGSLLFHYRDAGCIESGRSGFCGSDDRTFREVGRLAG